MISITEILLNGSHDVTNILLEKFEHDGTLKINKHFDFSGLCEEEITQIVIEYVEDDNICYENQNLLDNKLLNSIFLPKSSNNNLFSIFIDKISENETQHIQKLLTEQWTSYNTIVCFTFGAYQEKVYQDLALKFDNSFLVFVNEYNFEFSSSNINLRKVSIAHCYWYTPYFINKLCFESCNVRPRILYYIGENNTSIINSMPVEFSKIIRFSSIDVMENLKKGLEAAGASFKDVIVCDRFLTDMNQQDDLNKIWNDYFTDHSPASTTVQVVRLATDPRCLLEVNAIAVID